MKLGMNSSKRTGRMPLALRVDTPNFPMMVIS